MFSRIILLIVSVVISGQAYAFPEAPFNALEDFDQFVPMSVIDSEYDFNGIVRLSNCSGSIIKFIGQPDSSHAYLLTNGHCIGRFPEPGSAVINRRDNRRIAIYDGQGGSMRVRATTLVYATMTITDAAIYELEVTYEELSQRGIEAFTLAAERPMIGQPMEIVSGYWNRGFSCNIEHFVYKLQEADFEFRDSIRYSETGCEVYGGTSGSPIFAAGERLVIGINNTGNESGRECTMNNPCEIDENDNVLVIEGRGYGQQTHLFYSCLTPDFKVDVSLDSCNLPK